MVWRSPPRDSVSPSPIAESAENKHLGKPVSSSQEENQAGAKSMSKRPGQTVSWGQGSNHTHQHIHTCMKKGKPARDEAKCRSTGQKGKRRGNGRQSNG
jgi:hypothetical protein